MAWLPNAERNKGHARKTSGDDPLFGDRTLAGASREVALDRLRSPDSEDGTRQGRDAHGLAGRGGASIAQGISALVFSVSRAEARQCFL